MKIPVSVTKTVFSTALSPIQQVSIPTNPKAQDFISSRPKSFEINSNLITDSKQSISTKQILIILAVIFLIGLSLYAMHKKKQNENHKTDIFNF